MRIVQILCSHPFGYVRNSKPIRTDPNRSNSHWASSFKHSKKVKLSSLILDRPLASYALCSLQIAAIGRNYLDHVKELNSPIPKEPFFFLKPTSSYLPSQTPGAKAEIPRGVLAHHEGICLFHSISLYLVSRVTVVKLGLVIGTPDCDISQADALKHIAGYSEFPSLSLGYPLLRSAALAVDMTARNIQEVAKSKGLPWSAAHGMDTFTPIG